MDAEQAAKQIQALTASLEEVTHQNEELRRAVKSQNEEKFRRIEGNHNKEGSNS